MGFVVLHIDKGEGNDAGLTPHIERSIDPVNADPSRKHLDKFLIAYPDGIKDRTQAIQHRLDTAGLTRKIGTNQVRALRVILSGTREDMHRIEAEGQLDEWCDDNLAWLRKTYGADNVVSAVLHMDETSPHIHATVVPIVIGERRKAAQEKTKSADPGKKQYRKKKTDAPRLCADDVTARTKLKEYQTTYAEAMAKYGLERGIEGSEARHITHIEYARSIAVNKQAMEAEINHLVEIKETQRQEVVEQEQLTQQAQIRTEQAQGKAQQAEEGQKQAEAKLADTSKELYREKGKLTGQKLKNATAEAGTKIADGVSSLFGSSKIERQQQEIADLKADNEGLKEQLEKKDRQIGDLRYDHEVGNERLNKAHENEVNKLRQAEQTAKTNHRQQIESIGKWFPNAPQLAEMAEYCKVVGFTDPMITDLINLRPVRFSGDLYSPEYKKTFPAERSTAQIEKYPNIINRFLLTINGEDIVQRFKQKFEELQQKLDIKPTQSRGRGI